MSKKAIAIIGATGSTGSAIARNLAKQNYRLLLFGQETRKLNSLVKEIRNQTPSADIDSMNCAAEASWEADILITAIPLGDVRAIAEKIQPFTNRKIAIVLSPAGNKTSGNPASSAATIGNRELEALLHGARIVNVLVTSPSPRSSHAPSSFIATEDEAAFTLASDILRVAGYDPVFPRTFTNYKSKIDNMQTTKWSIDPAHSEIQFKVRHLMVSWVTGSFKKFDATLETEGDDITTASVRFTADVNSISTNNDQRDAHLRTGDFFDAENHPQVIFESDELEKIDQDNYKLYGTLTMRGTSKKIVLNVEFGGTTQDPWGNTRTGFSISGKLNRKDFGVNFSMVSETGGILLGEEVTFNSNVEFVKQAAIDKKAA